MHRVCSVPKCESNRSRYMKNSSPVPTFRLPRAAGLREKWLSAISRRNWKPLETSAVCIKHFDSGDILSVRGSVEVDNLRTDDETDGLKLKEDAVPTKISEVVGTKRKTPQERSRSAKTVKRLRTSKTTSNEVPVLSLAKIKEEEILIHDADTTHRLSQADISDSNLLFDTSINEQTVSPFGDIVSDLSQEMCSSRCDAENLPACLIDSIPNDSVPLPVFDGTETASPHVHLSLGELLDAQDANSSRFFKGRLPYVKLHDVIISGARYVEKKRSGAESFADEHGYMQTSNDVKFYVPEPDVVLENESDTPNCFAYYDKRGSHRSREDVNVLIEDPVESVDEKSSATANEDGFEDGRSLLNVFSDFETKFDGNGSVESFISAIITFKHVNGITDEEALRDFHALLRGRAFVWWKSYEFPLWDVALSRFKNTYGANFNSGVFRKILNSSQRPNENLESFVARVSALFSDIHYAVDTRIKLDILHALLSADARECMPRGSFGTVRELIEQAREIGRNNVNETKGDPLERVMTVHGCDECRKRRIIKHGKRPVDKNVKAFTPCILCRRLRRKLAWRSKSCVRCLRINAGIDNCKKNVGSSISSASTEADEEGYNCESPTVRVYTRSLNDVIESHMKERFEEMNDSDNLILINRNVAKDSVDSSRYSLEAGGFQDLVQKTGNSVEKSILLNASESNVAISVDADSNSGEFDAVESFSDGNKGFGKLDDPLGGINPRWNDGSDVFSNSNRCSPSSVSHKEVIDTEVFINDRSQLNTGSVVHPENSTIKNTAVKPVEWKGIKWETGESVTGMDDTVVRNGLTRFADVRFAESDKSLHPKACQKTAEDTIRRSDHRSNNFMRISLKDCFEMMAFVDPFAKNNFLSRQTYRVLTEANFKFHTLPAEVTIHEGKTRTINLMSTVLPICVETRSTDVLFWYMKGVDSRTRLGKDFINKAGIVVDIGRGTWHFRDNPNRVFSLERKVPITEELLYF